MSVGFTGAIAALVTVLAFGCGRGESPAQRVTHLIEQVPTCRGDPLRTEQWPTFEGLRGRATVRLPSGWADSLHADTIFDQGGMVVGDRWWTPVHTVSVSIAEPNLERLEESVAQDLAESPVYYCKIAATAPAALVWTGPPPHSVDATSYLAAYWQLSADEELALLVMVRGPAVRNTTMSADTLLAIARGLEIAH